MKTVMTSQLAYEYECEIKYMTFIPELDVTILNNRKEIADEIRYWRELYKSTNELKKIERRNIPNGFKITYDIKETMQRILTFITIY